MANHGFKTARGRLNTDITVTLNQNAMDEGQWNISSMHNPPHYQCGLPIY